VLAAGLATRAAEREPTQAEPPSAVTKAKAEAGNPDRKAKPEGRVRRGTNGEVVVTLELPTQKVMGLQTAALGSARVAPEMKGYGRVLDASPLITVTAELISAEAAVEASKAERKRLATLAGQNNASARALQAAEATAARDQAQAESARLRLLAAWGPAIANREDLPSFARSLAGLESVLVQIDLAAGGAVSAAPNGARLWTLANETELITAKPVGLAPTVDALSQGQGFLFLVSPNPAHLAPGQVVTGLLSLPGEPQTGVALPRSAVLRYNGAAWVYLQTDGTSFERKAVTLERPLPEAWFVRELLKPGDKVVIVGAQQMLSEELKGPDEGGE